MRLALTFVALLTVALLAAQTGGPDEFGYTWANSNTAAGPTYEWITPTNPNVLTGLADDWVSGQIPLGFDFPFYGQTYDYVHVCTNGIIGFSTDNITTWENMTIPNGDAPNNFIGWFWDDMNPTYTWANSVLEWENVTYNGQNAFLFTALDLPEYNNEGSYPNNCMQGQVLLIEDGSILVQYDWFGASFDRANASVGIENADGSIGLQYCYGDVSLLTDDLAIMFYPPGPTLDNDLAATGFYGEQFPSVGGLDTWFVTVENVGALDQLTYTVQLIDQNGMEIEEVDGIPLSSGSFIDMPVSLTLQNRDVTEMYARVILPNDENPENDATGYTPIWVQTSDVSAASIGYGDEMQRLPFDFYYRASLTETVYHADDLDVDSGLLTQLAWRADFYEPCWDMPVRIWVGETTQDDLGDGWIGAGDLTLVFDGQLDFPAERSIVHAPLQTFYDYQGDNLVVLVEHMQTTGISSAENAFLCTDALPGQPECLRAWQSDVDPADPNAPEGGQLLSLHPNTHLFFTVGQTDVAVIPWSPEGVVLGYLHVTLTGDENYEAWCDGGQALMEDVAPGYYDLAVEGAGFIDYLDENVRIAHSAEFEVALMDSLRAPQDVFCSAWAVLRWESPWTYDETREVVQYNIYLNYALHDTLVTSDIECVYTYDGLENDTDYTAGVSAVYTQGESEVVHYGFHFLPVGEGGVSAAVTALAGASPNPFNPSTSVHFSLAQPGHATLCAYDIRGRKVATLADDSLSAGDHTVVWEPADAASGVYLLRLTAGDKTLTTRAVLLK